MKPAQILIVDDDRDMAESLADYVEILGHEATIACNGQEAVDHHRKSRFDITFMDVRMPVMNGIDSFFEIRKLKPSARIVLMTGFKEPNVNKALQHGVLGLLLKPFPLSELLAWIDGVIGEPHSVERNSNEIALASTHKALPPPSPVAPSIASRTLCPVATAKGSPSSRLVRSPNDWNR